MLLQKKICLIGDFAVGKTSLIRRFVFDQFDDKYLTTIGVHITKKEIQISDTTIKLLIWDLAGEDGFQKIISSYLTGSSGFIIVGDMSRPDSLEHIKKHILQANTTKKIPIVVAMNKVDLMKSEEEKKKAVDSVDLDKDIPVFLTSSKTGENVENLFQHLSEMILKEHSV